MQNNNMNMKKRWAIITGASGGLGTSFALACARRGYQLLLIDLPGKNIAALGEFISKNFQVESRWLEADITLTESAAMLKQLLQDNNMQVNMLINNAGMSQNDMFEDTGAGYMKKMIELNCIAPVMMIKSILPELMCNKPSYILNVSSLGSFYPLPRKSCYAATKAFVRQFSQALKMEIGHLGVQVSIVCPGPMTTNIPNYILHRNLNWIARKTKMHPAAVAERALSKMFRGKEIIIPGRLNRIMKFISSVIPAFIRKKLALYSMRQLEQHSSPGRGSSGKIIQGNKREAA